ncbi:MAG: NAD(+)/NADH kinase [Oscillospiraceae bacterium]|nr:NAD(+)/NADH kinase [Oscillospiraceae bacterium]
MKTVLLFPNENKDAGLTVTRAAVSVLRGLGMTCLIPDALAGLDSGAEARPLDEALERAEMIISVGGDGTLLRAARAAMRRGLPLLGINAGRTGFLTELERDETHLLSRVAAGDYSIDCRALLETTLMRKSEETGLALALNDVVVTRGGCAQAMMIDLLVDGRVMSSLLADGLIVATPTGSTAYSMSAGGPVVEPDADCIVVTPICPHALYAHSFVLSARRELVLRPLRLEERPAFVTVDGAKPVDLEPGDRLRVRRSARVVEIVRLKERHFYDVISDKLKDR